MKKLTSTTALAAALSLGFYGTPWAQAVDPNQPGSASGGILAQGGTGTMTQPGTTRSGAGQAGSQGGSQAGAMTEQQIRTALTARGYSEIKGMERDGDHFTVDEAKRYGKTVEDLRIDARTGQVRDEERLSEDQARNLLRNRGYSDISNVSRDGDTISAKAKQGDREVNLRIDARSGTVTQQQASN